MMQAERGRLVKRGNFFEELRRHFVAALQSAAWFCPGIKIGAAVSGGAYSVALLTLLAETRAQLGLVLSVVHFNHKLRGRASDGDENFVTELPRSLASLCTWAVLMSPPKPNAKNPTWKTPPAAL